MSQDVKLGVQIEGNALGKLKELNESAERLEKKLEGVHEIGKELFSTIGVGFAALAGFEFLKEGLQEYKQINIQAALLNNQLRNSGKYSEELVESLKEQREVLKNESFFKEDDILKFQTLLTRAYSNANNEFRKQFGEVVGNLAAEDGNLAEHFSELQHALQLKPSAKGDKVALKKELAFLSDAEFEKHRAQIMKAAEPGHVFADEMLPIIAEITKGRREAVIQADPMVKLNHDLEEFRINLGHLVQEIQKRFLPQFDKAILFLDDLVTNHFDQIKEWAIKIAEGLKILAEVFIAKKLIGVIIGVVEGFQKLQNWLSGVSLGASAAALDTSAVSLDTAAVALNGAAIALDGAAVALGGVSGLKGIGLGAAALGGEAVVAGEAVTTTTALGTLGSAALGVAGVLTAITLLFPGDNARPNNKPFEYYTTPTGERYYNPNNRMRQELQKNGQLKTETPEEVDERLHPKLMKITDETKFKNFLGETFDKFTHLPILDKVFKGIKKGKEDAESHLKPLSGLAANKSKPEMEKINGSNRQFIINIYGGLINKLENHYEEEGSSASDTKEDIKRAIIEGITEALNSMPGYSQ